VALTTESAIQARFYGARLQKEGEFVDKHVVNINELNGEEQLEYVVIDPSVKSVRGGSGRKVDTEYKEEWEKVFKEKMPMRYANNDVNAGIARVHKYLRLDPEREHIGTKVKGAPRVYIFDTLTNLIEELEGYKWKKIIPTNENDPDEAPRKKDDHLVDPLRYIVMSRPDISQGSVASKVDKEKKQDKIDPHKQLLEHSQKLFPRDFIKLND